MEDPRGFSYFTPENKKESYLPEATFERLCSTNHSSGYLMNQTKNVMQAALIMECPQIRVDVVPECPCVSLNEGVADWKEARI